MIGRSVTISIDGDEPVSLVEAKRQLRVDFDTDNSLIEAYVSAAREYCEILIGYSLVSKNIRTYFDGFGEYLSLIGPLGDDGITSVKYRDSDNEERTMSATEYSYVPGKTLRLYPAASDGWPEGVALTPGAVVVEHFAKAAVNSSAKAAILLMVTDLYENRADGARRYPTASDKILNLLRENVFG